MNRKPTIAIWGLGCIGCTSAMAYAEAGCAVIGYDIDGLKVKCLQEGVLPIPGLEAWFGTRWADAPPIQVTTDVAEIAEATVTAHLICVPTERGGEPWGGAVLQVLEQIATRPTTREPSLVIIESTLDLAMWQTIREAYPQLRLAVSPRRDWFVSKAHSLEVLTRVYSAPRPADAAAAEAILRLVCREVQRVADVETAILGKLIENTLLHLGATLAGELACRYPQHDVRGAFEVAATHWRTPLFYPAAGVGGQCVPLAPRYLRRAARAQMGVLEYLQVYDQEQPRRVAEVLRRARREAQAHGQVGPTVILGLTYKADVPVIADSPGLAILQQLRLGASDIVAHEPYRDALAWPDTELPTVHQGPVADLLREAAVIFVHTPHAAYREPSIIHAIRPGTIILDHTGLWRDHRARFAAAGITYRVLGKPGWMGEL